ncbi:MAG: molybdopterin-dependent oxidoreductase [Microthrixaceae bacterium]|nr:molybdopterin-dependent oxidoreductase [Microthrixaceae bacterium]
MHPQIGMLVPTMRFGATVGTTRLDVNASINDFWAGFQQVYGKFFPTFSYDDLFHSDVILIWHANPAYTAIPLFHYMTEARYRGAQVVLIAPDVSPSHTHADLFVPVQPGTDAALAMSMAQVILSEGSATRASFAPRRTCRSWFVAIRADICAAPTWRSRDGTTGSSMPRTPDPPPRTRPISSRAPAHAWRARGRSTSWTVPKWRSNRSWRCCAGPWTRTGHRRRRPPCAASTRRRFDTSPEWSPPDAPMCWYRRGWRSTSTAT